MFSWSVKDDTTDINGTQTDGPRGGEKEKEWGGNRKNMTKGDASTLPPAITISRLL